MSDAHMNNEDVKTSIDVILSSLHVIAGIARSNGNRAIQEILMTAEVGIARVNAIFPPSKGAIEESGLCDYFREKDCLSGCPLVACHEAGSCQKP